MTADQLTTRQETYDDITKPEQEELSRLTQEYNLITRELTPEQIAFMDTKLSSKMWRISNLYTIMDRDGVKMIMRLNRSQRRVLTEYKHSKKLILKSRQQGISTLFLAYYLDDCLFKPGFQAGIQSYGQDEAEKLSKRALLMWDEMDSDIKDLLGLKLVGSNSKGMTFSNGSILKIGNFRGDTLQGLHVSELGKIAKKYPEKAKELKTGAFQAVGKNNKISVESTSEGSSGMFYDMCVKAMTHEGPLGPFDFQFIFLSWVEDPECTINTPKPITEENNSYFAEIEEELDITLTDQQKWWYISKSDELGEYMGQEYPTTPEEAFRQSLEGAYYKNVTLNIAQDDPYDPNLLVHSSFDLGMSDTFSIGFFQYHPDHRVKIVGEYENSGHGLEYYRDVFKLLSRQRGWKFGVTYVPHDIKVRELIADKTRFKALRELGFNPTLVKKHRVVDGIEATRQFLGQAVIYKDCEIIRKGIATYRKKYDNRLGVFLDAPEHDEASHTADMLRYMAMGVKHSPPKSYVTRPMNFTSGYSNDFDI